MTSTMRAALQESYGDPHQIRIAIVDRPAPGPDEVLIEVRAAALSSLGSRADGYFPARGDRYEMVVTGECGTRSDGTFLELIPDEAQIEVDPRWLRSDPPQQLRFFLGKLLLGEQAGKLSSDLEIEGDDGNVGHGHEQCRVEDLQLASQEWPAGGDLVRLRVAIVGRAALHHVGDEDVVPSPADHAQQLIEEIAGTAHEGAALAVLTCLCVELVHEIDDIEEPAPGSIADAGAGYGDGEVGLARSGTTDEDCIALLGEEVAAGQITHKRLVDRCLLEAELIDLLGQGQLGDRHLVLDRARLLLADLGIQQVADDLLRLVLTLHRRGDDLIVGGLHAVELQLARRAGGTPLA